MDNSPLNPKYVKMKTNPKKDINILSSNLYKYYNEYSSFNSNSNFNTNYNISSNLNLKNIISNKNQSKENNKKPEILKTITEDTSQYIEEMKKGSYNILVAVRSRPLSQKEKEISDYETIQIMERRIIILKDPNGYLNPNNIRTKEQTLAFDYVFDQYEGQKDIFNCTTKFLIEGVTNGFNATVFAYGATGAGKTYTMLGTEENPGIMSLTLNELFERIKSYPEREYNIKLWYLEIYNENIRDLLVNNSENLELREDPNKGLIVNGITEITPKSSEHILNILKKGNKNRTTESTNANETSSRSHAILQIMVSYKEKASGINYEIKFGKLNLIDLAGSERASMTKNKGMRLFEGANINKSLLTLGNCINALCEANEKGVKTYIPYRDSKLTRLLKDSLGGNARTVMIANISPFIYSFDDTYNTLKYADRAKHIKTNIKRNVLNAQYHITNYLNIIKNLQKRIFDLENQMSINKKRDFTISPIKKIRDDTNENEIMNQFNNINLIKNKNISVKKENKKNAKNNNINIYNECDKVNSEENEYKDYKEEINNKYNNIIKDFTFNFNKEIILKQEIFNLKKELFSLNNNNSNSKTKKRLINLKNKLNNCQNSYEEISNKNGKEYSLLKNNEEIDEVNKNQINLIYENKKINLENIDLKLKIFKMKFLYDKSKQYIKDLEEQIKLRDIIIERNNKIFFNEKENQFLNILNKEQISKFKSLNQMQNQNNSIYYSNKKKQDFSNKFKKRNENVNLEPKDSQLILKTNTQMSKNSSFSLNLNPTFSESNDFLKSKMKNDNETNELYLPKLSFKISNTCSKDNNEEDVYNSSIKSMLNNIKEINSDINFKFNIIEQKDNNSKNKNNHNINKSQDNTINNINNNMTYSEIPYNNNSKTKNIIQNLFKKENEKNAQTNSSYKVRNKLNSVSKKLKNIPSACNIKTINKGNSNKATNLNTPNNIKNNKNESRAKSTIIKNLPKSAKSTINLKSNASDKNIEIDVPLSKETEIYKINDNKEKIMQLEELFNKAKEEIMNKRNNKFQNSEPEINNNFNKNTNPIGKERIDSYFIDNKIYYKNKDILQTKKKNKNKQASPFYKGYKVKTNLLKFK